MPSEPANSCPLYVDLDGTLIAGDSLWESLMAMIRTYPLLALCVPFWILRGKAYFKDQVAARVHLDVARLPYRQDVVEFVMGEKRRGRHIVLATATHQSIARQVADHLTLFDDILASDAALNLRGSGKLAAIQAKGTGPFDYAGDSPADLPIFKACRQAYVVGASPAFMKRVAFVHAQPIPLGATTRRGPAIFAALRAKHWVKNLLLFLPLLFAHQFFNLHKLVPVGFSFVAMSLCASGVYVLNDLLDLEADRAHPRKRNRPFASGALSIPMGLGMCAALMLSGVAIALICVGWQFTAVLGGYIAATMSYSLVFKRKLLLDVILLAGLYTARILAGAVAALVPVSSWLAAFSMFLFISLAFVKRYSELTMLKLTDQTQTKGRSYMVDDLDILLSVGPTSGYMSILVFCLYISSDAVTKLYVHPEYLWCACPIMIYWITRVWFFARRHKLDDDPVIFAIRDRVTWLCGLVLVILVLAAGPKPPAL